MVNRIHFFFRARVPVFVYEFTDSYTHSDNATTHYWSRTRSLRLEPDKPEPGSVARRRTLRPARPGCPRYISRWRWRAGQHQSRSPFGAPLRIPDWASPPFRVLQPGKDFLETRYMGNLNPKGVFENNVQGLDYLLFLFSRKGDFFWVFWWVGGDFDCKQKREIHIHTLKMHENKILYGPNERNHLILVEIVSYFIGC